jgi:hypothetical protein
MWTLQAVSEGVSVATAEYWLADFNVVLYRVVICLVILLKQIYCPTYSYNGFVVLLMVMNTTHDFVSPS